MEVFTHRSFTYSFFLHAGLFALWALVYGTQSHRLQNAPRNITYIEVDPIVRPKATSQAERRVVQTERGHETTEAAQDALLGEKTQTVDKQQTATAHFEPTAPSRARRQAKPAAQPLDASKPMEFSKSALANLGVALPQPGKRPEDEASEEVGSLAAQVKGEYVKGFKTGEKTLLNTREYVFYGYFQRIREKLDRAWEKSLKEKLAKYFYKGRQLASDMDYTTKILVTLDHQGQVTRVQILGQSGTRDLEDAAVKAFNDAGPFPNPPRGLVDGQSSTIQVRWDFVLRT